MLVQKLKVDDVVGAFAVHGACGLWGIIALGLFGNPDDGLSGNGVLHGGNQLGVQILAGIIITLWVGGLSCAIFLPLRLLKDLRLGDDFQDRGADLMEHSPQKAYSDDEPATNDKPQQPTSDK